MDSLLELGDGDVAGYDPWQAAAAAVRRRYPTRPVDPLTQAASNLTWSQWAGDPRAEATNVYYGENFDPSATLKAAIGTVGAPAVGPAQGGAVLGAGAIRPANLVDLLGQYPTTTARRILGETAREGGYTVQLPTGVRPTEGLMMGIYPNADPRTMVLAGKPTAANLQEFVAQNVKPLQAENRYLGTWRDPESGQTYFDVSQRFDPEAIRTATKFGERTGQISGYDIGAKQTFPVGNWMQFIRGPEYRGRLREMADVGRQYLNQFPTKEWWDMYGSPFERVYGRENLPQVAGYTASTAPMTSPLPNLQQMSEYMRRHILGEPIIQPEWRTPEGLMTYQPGNQIPMEASRVANLLRSQRGALGELSKAKVREEAAAMTGDPNAVVIDRHQVRLGEAPERGIFASTEQGTISADPTKKLGGLSDYDVQANVIRDEARAQNRDPRDYSADAWTGIRETIKNTGELYGTKFKGSAITGESKSYADQFDDLLGRKAAHLGISQDELEKRLRGGDANLMSWLLATTPAAAAAFQQWRTDQNATPSND